MFKNLTPYQLQEKNIFELIDKDWMLITAGSKDDFNTMTASWGQLGIMWNLPVAICYVRPQRHTFTYVNTAESYTLSFFEDKHRDILKFCGTKSGRDYDKVKETGLNPLLSEFGNIYFEQARLVLECKKIYVDDLKPANFAHPGLSEKHYPKEDFHRFYIGEIISVLHREN